MKILAISHLCPWPGGDEYLLVHEEERA